MKSIYFVLLLTGTIILLMLSPRMDHKAVRVESVQQIQPGKVKITIQTAGAYNSQDGLTRVIYGLTTTGEPITALVNNRTDTTLPLRMIGAQRTYTLTGDIIDSGVLMADSLTPEKSIPLVHETVQMTLDETPNLTSKKGHQYTFEGMLNGQDITLTTTLGGSMEREVTGYWQQDRRTFVVVG